MAWWKTLLTIIFSILLVSSAVLLTLNYSLYKTLSYENLKPTFKEAVKSQLNLNEEQLAMIHTFVKQNCTQETTTLPIEGFMEIELNCSDVKKTTPQTFIDLVIDTAFNKIYYKKYDKNFLEILKELPSQADKPESFIVFCSEFAHQSFKKGFNYLIAIVVVLTLLIILLNKLTALNSLGVDFIIIGVPYFFIKYFVLERVTTMVPEFAISVVNSFFFSLMWIYLIFFIVGIVFLVAYIFLKVIERKKKGRKEKRKKGREEEKKKKRK